MNRRCLFLFRRSLDISRTVPLIVFNFFNYSETQYTVEDKGDLNYDFKLSNKHETQQLCRVHCKVPSVGLFVWPLFAFFFQGQNLSV